MGAVKLTKNANSGKYLYSGFGTGFDTCWIFLLSDGIGFGKIVIIFGIDNSSSVHSDNRKKNIFVLGKDPADELYNTTLTARAEYSINFSEQQDIFCLSLHNNGSNSCLFVNEVKIFQFKARSSN